MKKNQQLIGWFLFGLLAFMILGLNYVKFFSHKDGIYVKEVSEGSSSKAVDLALTEIVDQFNQSSELSRLNEQGIKMSSLLSHHSIFVSYETHMVSRFEFQYHNFHLSISILNNEDSLKKIRDVLVVLVSSV